MIRLLQIVAVLSGILFGSVKAGDNNVELRSVKDAVTQSLPFIIEEGQLWMDEKDCVSCHQIPFMVWALNSAGEKGFDIDAQKLESWNSWPTAWQKMVNPKNRDDANETESLARANDAIAQLLLGLPRNPDAPSEGWQKSFVESLAVSQEENGSWNPGGQLPSQKRPKRETREVSTMWSLVALTQTQHSSKTETHLKVAQAFIANNKSTAESSEWWAMRLWLSSLLGDENSAEACLEHLKQNQHDDGGWGWRLEDPSDALGTSIVMYAMSKHGLGSSDPAVKAATQFLVTTQNEDGTWNVNGTKSGSRDSLTETSVYWGTCWAVIALSELLPAP